MKTCFLCGEKIKEGSQYQEIIKRVYNIEGPTISYYRHLDCDVQDLTTLLILIDPELRKKCLNCGSNVPKNNKFYCNDCNHGMTLKDL